MKKLIINIITVIIIVGIAIFLQHKYFPNVIDNSTHTSDTMWKDSIQIEYYPKAYPAYRDTGSVKIVKLPIDSAAITKAYLKLHQDFYSTYFYEDTLKEDSIAFIKVNTQISQNKPLKYTLNYFDRTPSIINNTTNIYTQNEFYIGLEVGSNKIAPSLLFKSKKNYIFGVEYNLLNNGIPGDRLEVKGYMNINKLKIW